MGLFENPIFAKGTNELAQAIALSPAYKVIGGGDTISAVDKIHLLDKFDFVSNRRGRDARVPGRRRFAGSRSA